MSFVTPNMQLTLPSIGVDTNPTWSNLLNAALVIVDAHTHQPGSGVPITPSAMTINADLPMVNNNLTNVRSVRFQNQNSNLSASGDVGCVFVSGGNFWFNNSTGSHVQITNGSGLAGTPGTIGGLTSPASATYDGVNTFVWQSNTNTPGNIDGASIILRNLSANSKGLTLNPPAAMASNYALTLPPIPSAPAHLLSIDAAGNITAAQATIVSTDFSNQCVPQTALAARSTGTSVGAGGVAISTSSGAFTTSSASYVAVTNLSVTITTTGRPVLLYLMPDGTTNPGYVGVSLVSNNSSPFGGFVISNQMAMFRGTTQLNCIPVQSTMNFVQVGNTYMFTIPPGGVNFLDTPAAGTYTYTVKSLVPATPNGTATGYVNYCQLYAWEI